MGLAGLLYLLGLLLRVSHAEYMVEQEGVETHKCCLFALVVRLGPQIDAVCKRRSC